MNLQLVDAIFDKLNSTFGIAFMFYIVKKIYDYMVIRLLLIGPTTWFQRRDKDGTSAS